MSSSTVTTQLGTGLTSLVLSKKYLSCAQPPSYAYKLEHEIKVDEDRGGWSPTTSAAWAPGPPPQSIVAVQARYEPSDVFTPLVFEEILQQQQQQQQPVAPVWIRPLAEQRMGVQQQHVVHHQHQHLHHHHHHNTRQQAAHPVQHGAAAATAPSAGSHQVRRPLQHLPPAAQSTLQPPANKSDQLHHQQQQQQQQLAAGGNKPGDLSWLVNFQVASIFEPTCNATAAAVGGTPGNSFTGDWHLREQSDTLKSCNSKKKTSKTDNQKPSSKINRKPYRMPPSRLDKANKPGYTYTEMIHQALMEKKELPVAEIYQWISSHFPYFREDDERWKNSVRHNLSINPNFRKGRKSQGAGHYWRLCNTEESLGHREYSTAIEEDVSNSPQDSAELEQACKYLEGELQREDSLEDVKLHTSIDTELENEIYTNSFLISSPSKYVNEQISLSNNNDFHSYSENLLEEPIDFQYYNL